MSIPKIPQIIYFKSHDIEHDIVDKICEVLFIVGNPEEDEITIFSNEKLYKMTIEEI